MALRLCEFNAVSPIRFRDVEGLLNHLHETHFYHGRGTSLHRAKSVVLMLEALACKCLLVKLVKAAAVCELAMTTVNLIVEIC